MNNQSTEIDRGLAEAGLSDDAQADLAVAV